MRIQHNIPAMSAYRNYTNNTSALSKNLEKLSSGYKINRAGDDAAGLAISEKMRAQITGLEVAQKNAKDGISLVQTAEGALTEVHSMLNRMYELAEQSANGTYDNEVDRTQLQKEVNQLRSEINRISQASNFNGIKLLDGSMNAGDVTMKTLGASVPVKILDGDATSPFTEVGKKTVLKEDGTTAKETIFTANLENVLIVNAQEGDKLTMKVGDDVELELTVAATKGDASTITAEDAANETEVAKAFAALFADATKGPGGKINDQAFTATANGSAIEFKQTGKPTNENQVIDANLPVEVTYAPKGKARTTAYEIEKVETTTKNVGGLTNVDVSVSTPGADFYAKTKDADTPITATLSLSGANDDVINVAFTGLDGLTVKSLSLVTTKETITGTAADGVQATADPIKSFSATLSDDTVITIAGDFSGWSTGTPAVEFTAKTKAAAAPPAPPEGGIKGSVPGTYSVHTTKNQQGAMDSKGVLASTKIDLTDKFAKDGGMLKIGKTTYVFKVGDESTVTDEGVTVDTANGENKKLITISDADLAYFGSDKKAAIIDAIGQALSNEDNSAFDLGYDKEANTLSIHEKTTQNVYNKELQDHKEFQKLISAGTVDMTTTKKGDGTSLTLQIGDTAESFNKLIVDIKACNAEGMGIADIDISTQEGASAAMDAIKNAINYVSDVRGDLGATQNRLDHTINNLSVMQENIQDAESTIRDVDVAKEMMEYTKNNILVQSAQAMLAQANQLPQGVLQLLQ